MGLTLTGCYIIVKTWKIQLYEDKLGKKREFSLDYQPYGDAHWAEPCEYSKMAKIRPLQDCKGTILGQLTEDGTQCVDMYKPPRINKHILAVGSSGAGKSFSLVEPYIMQAVKQRHSIIVTDPKGELYSDMAGYLEDHGYYVRRFDLITLAKSDGWDCMKFLRGLSDDELETNAQIFATIIVTNIEAEESVYSRGSIALLKALVLYTILRRDIPEEEKTIARVNEMLQQEGVEYFEKIFGKSCPEYMKPAQSSYRTFAQASPNLHGNIVSHLATGMQIIQTSIVEKILSTDDINLNLPGDKPCAYFCRFSATNNTFRFVSAMFFSMLFISLIDHADRSPTKKLNIPVDFVMDEFPSIGRIPDWLEKISNIRSYGITAVMIVQGISQIRGIYGDDAIMIIGNCGTILNIGMNDEETAEWFQTRMGLTSIKVSTEQVEGGEVMTMSNSLLGRESRGVGKDFLMSVSDIYNMSVDDTIIIFQHCNPIYAHKVPIIAFPEFKNCRKIYDKDIPDFDDKEARRRVRAEEELRIARYNREHPYVEDTEEEIYEEPVDFSSMGTLSILTLITKEELRDLKKKLGKGKSVPKTAKTGSEDASPVVEAPQSAQNISNPSADVYFDDDSDFFDDLEDDIIPRAVEEPERPEIWPEQLIEPEREPEQGMGQRTGPELIPQVDAREELPRETPATPKPEAPKPATRANSRPKPGQRPTPKTIAGNGPATLPPRKGGKNSETAGA